MIIIFNQNQKGTSQDVPTKGVPHQIPAGLGILRKCFVA